MIDHSRDTATALSVLVERGLPVSAATLPGKIERIGRFDESTGQIVPLSDTPLPAASTVCVAGWAVDLAAKGAGAGVCIRVGAAMIDAHYGDWRDDIGTEYGGPAYVRTGFRGFVTLDRALRGKVQVSAVAVGANARSSAVLPGGRTISVVAGVPTVNIGMPHRAGSAVVHVDAWHLQSGAEVAVDDALMTPRGSLVSLRGWVFDGAAEAPPAAVFAVVDDQDVVRGNAWQPRPDVTAVKRRDNLLPTGFTVRIDTAALGPGWHYAQIGMLTADGTAFDVDARRYAFAIVPDHR